MTEIQSVMSKLSITLFKTKVHVITQFHSITELFNLIKISPSILTLFVFVARERI